MQQSNNVQLRTFTDAGEQLGIGQTRLYKLVQAGEIKAVKIGVRGKRIHQTEIDRFAREGVKALG